MLLFIFPLPISSHAWVKGEGQRAPRSLGERSLARKGVPGDLGPVPTGRGREPTAGRLLLLSETVF